MTDEIIAGPAAEDIAPKKPRRGRPPKVLNEDGTIPTPPRRVPRRRKSLEDNIGGTIALLNIPLALVAPVDALDDQEIVAIAKGVDGLAQENPTVHKYLSSVMGSGGSIGRLALILGAILARRASRHNILPRAMDARLRMVLAMAGAPLPADDRPPARDEYGAPVNAWPDSEPVATAEPVAVDPEYDTATANV
jgi:hypothetical protein